jgi:carbonic anhydrase
MSIVYASESTTNHEKTETKIDTKTEHSSAVTKEEAYNRLIEGNNRFASGKRTFDFLERDKMKELADKGQHPFATILTCSDSRVPAEFIFDATLGDIFVVRVAGNVGDTDEVATIEYGTEHLKTPVLVVLGHTKCGAVTAVTQEARVEGNLPALLDNIRPALVKVKSQFPDLKGDDLINKCITENVWTSIQDVFNKSAIVRELVRKGHLLVVGAVYDIRTGTIKWLGPHPDEKKLIGGKSE